MAHLLNTPQLKIPFQVVGPNVSCVEQDSFEDRTQNAIVIMRYRPGQRSGLLQFGIPDPVFNDGGVDLVDLARRIRQWEPDLEIEDLSQTIGQDGENIITVTFRGDTQE